MARRLLADDLLQLRRAADLLVQAGPHQPAGDLDRRRSSSTSACGASGSTSSSPRCTATSCRRSGRTTAPTWVDISLFIGTIGLFSTLFLLFLKFVPAVAVTEVKELRHELEHDPTRPSRRGDARVSGGGDHERSGFVPRRFVIAQFADAGRAARRARASARGREQEPGHAHAVSGARAGRGAGPRPAEDPDAWCCCGAIAGACIAYGMIYLHERHRLPDQRRRAGRRTARRPTSRSRSSWRCCWAAARRSSASSRWRGLPKPYHPVFESELLPRASIDGFFLSVEVPAGANADKVAADVRGAGRRRGAELVAESER